MHSKSTDLFFGLLKPPIGAGHAPQRPDMETGFAHVVSFLFDPFPASEVSRRKSTTGISACTGCLRSARRAQRTPRIVKKVCGPKPVWPETLRMARCGDCMAG